MTPAGLAFGREAWDASGAFLPMKKLLLVLVLLTVSLARADDAPALELRGVLATGAGTRFCLSTTGGGHASAWLSVGEAFEGWKLAEFRDKENVLILRRDNGTEVKLSLASSRVATADVKATLADAEEVFRKMNFEQMFAKILDQQKQNQLAMMKKMIPAGGRNGVTAADMADVQKKAMDVMFEALDPEQMKNDLMRIYSEVFTKDELRGLADFYGTATGTAMMAAATPAIGMAASVAIVWASSSWGG